MEISPSPCLMFLSVASVLPSIYFSSYQPSRGVHFVFSSLTWGGAIRLGGVVGGGGELEMEGRLGGTIMAAGLSLPGEAERKARTRKHGQRFDWKAAQSCQEGSRATGGGQVRPGSSAALRSPQPSCPGGSAPAASATDGLDPRNQAIVL